MNEKTWFLLSKLPVTQFLAFQVLSNKDDRYLSIQRTLTRFGCVSLGRRDKATLVAILAIINSINFAALQ